MPRTHDDEERASPRQRRRRRKPQPKDYLVTLHPWAAKLNARRLNGIKLSQILAGKTCSPISLADFELYLVYREMSIEQLQFVVWFNDYRKRISMSGSAHAHSPTVRSASISSLSSTVTATSLHSKRPTLSNTIFTDPTPVTPLPPLKLDTTFNDPSLRQECMHVISTFLVPGSPKELLLDADRREKLIKALETSCHPDLFLSVYEEVYFNLEQEILPRFLAYALPNINLPKQILWYICGAFLLFLSICAAALMIAFIPPPVHNRAYRIVLVPVFHLGVTAVYAAFQGFCAQVFARDTVQLHSWELRQVDEEAETYVNYVRSSLRANTSIGLVCNSTDGSYGADFKQISGIPANPRLDGHTHASTSMTRPPMFGPEKVVQDPTILKAHRQIMNGLWTVGFISDILFSAIIFSIPGRST